jgi:hypothetical protein
MAACADKNPVQKAITGNLAIPDFQRFCAGLVDIFEQVRPDQRGHNATYIPELASVPPEKFGFAICTGTLRERVRERNGELEQRSARACLCAGDGKGLEDGDGKREIRRSRETVGEKERESGWPEGYRNEV